MNMFEVVPKGRDAGAKALYIFTRRFLRCQRDFIEAMVERDLENLFLYGTTRPDIDRPVPKGLLS